MLTEENRTDILSLWAGLVSVVAIYFLIGSFWKAALIGAFVGGSAVLRYGTRWVLKGSFDLLPNLPPFIRRVCSGYTPDRGVLRTQLV